MTTDERLEKMEAQLARVRWLNHRLIAGIVLSLALWGLTQTFGPETAWAQSSLKEIRANSLILEDEKGNRRASLLALKEGAKLFLGDEKGTLRVALSVEGLTLLDENEKPRIDLSVLKEGPGATLRDEKGRVRADLLLFKEGPKLSLNDENQKPRMVLSVLRGWAASLGLRGENSNVRADPSLFLEGPRLSLLDEDGKVTWSAP